MTDSFSRNVATTAHASGALAAFFLPSIGGWLGPALIWAINQHDAGVVAHAREALKFQLAMSVSIWLIGAIGAGLACFLFGPLIWLLALIPYVASIAFGVMATVHTHNGTHFAYPITGTPLLLR